jgi:uncharacterized HAD superfamily protein
MNGKMRLPFIDSGMFYRGAFKTSLTGFRNQEIRKGTLNLVNQNGRIYAMKIIHVDLINEDSLVSATALS